MGEPFDLFLNGTVFLDIVFTGLADLPARGTEQLVDGMGSCPGGIANLGIAASRGGTPYWWQSDGAFIPLRYSALLRRTAGEIAEDEPHLKAQPHRSRGNGPVRFRSNTPRTCRPGSSF